MRCTLQCSKTRFFFMIPLWFEFVICLRVILSFEVVIWAAQWLTLCPECWILKETPMKTAGQAQQQLSREAHALDVDSLCRSRGCMLQASPGSATLWRGQKNCFGRTKKIGSKRLNFRRESQLWHQPVWEFPVLDRAQCQESLSINALVWFKEKGTTLIPNLFVSTDQ